MRFHDTEKSFIRVMVFMVSSLTRNKIVMRVVGANDLIKASTFSCVVSINYDR